MRRASPGCRSTSRAPRPTCCRGPCCSRNWTSLLGQLAGTATAWRGGAVGKDQRLRRGRGHQGVPRPDSSEHAYDAGFGGPAACWIASKRCPAPSVAALHGFALGGGLELALACRYRVAVGDERLALGLPEVQLGIHPGFGGTVRTVRLLGVRAAMDLMLTGRTIRADKALQDRPGRSPGRGCPGSTGEPPREPRQGAPIAASTDAARARAVLAAGAAAGQALDPQAAASARESTALSCALRDGGPLGRPRCARSGGVRRGGTLDRQAVPVTDLPQPGARLPAAGSAQGARRRAAAEVRAMCTSWAPA